MLPYDNARCHPVTPDEYCKNCMRCAQHPEQTWGERTPQFAAMNSMDEKCRYIKVENKNDRR